MHAVATLKTQLEALGVRRGDVLMVHASLRRIGPVEGRARGVVQALLEVLGPDGTMLMVLGADPDVPFDRWTTPVEDGIGMLAEVFRTYPGAYVSDHAVGRYAAFGPRARELIDDTPLHDYHGPGSPLERLVNARGQIVRLGADLETLTLTHLAEYLAKLPNKRRVRRRRVLADGTELWVESLDDDDGIVPFDAEEEEEEDEDDYFPKVLADFLAAGHARVGPVGGCTAELIEASEFLPFAVAWLERELPPQMG